MKNARRWFVVAVMGALLATACGGASSSAAETAEATSAEAATTQESAAAATTGRTTASAGESAVGSERTLGDYLGSSARLVAGQRGGRFDADEVTQEQQLIEQEVQLCMQAQGFVYTPEDRTDTLRLFLASDGAGVSAAEYAETQGFGISTRFDQLLENDLDLTEDVSPNDEHLATLSDGEADAWQLALSGAPPERNDQGQLIDPETGEVIPGGRNRVAGGCRGEAQATVRGDAALLAELEDEFAELAERIDADPRIAEIARDWADCMRDRGFAYETPSEARAEINIQFRPLLRSFFQSATAQEGGGQGNQGGQGGGGNRLERIAGLTLSPEQEVELGALQDLERSIAVASLDCSGDTAEEIDTITARYEAEFVEANRDALEAFAR